MTLTTDQLTALRVSGTITDEEIAILEGDLIVAKNGVTESRRIIGKASEVLVESNQRRILKG